MAKNAGKPSALEAALRLLSVRARSCHELRLLLERKGFGQAEQHAALQKLSSLGYLDDGRFAQDRALMLLRGGFGPKTVVQRLGVHGLSEEQARAALGSAEAELGTGPVELARSVLDRRGLLGGTLGLKAYARAARLLAARGFSESVVEEVLGTPPLDPRDGGE